mmetsp:Transcript_3156/g.9612  ORF Transcript_3156/g.9612 Transcript_3156/m.9612 type:complete len:1277 (+) Transcript_3156:392-4222(+)
MELEGGALILEYSVERAPCLSGPATHRLAAGTLTPVSHHPQRLLLANTLTGDGVEDMTRLNYLHEPALLANLRHRFERDHVYTYTGKICIAVNPFNWQVSKPLYEEEVLLRYRGHRLGELAPHIYAIAEDAYQKIQDDVARSSNQSILVSGESGAGKTESVKIMMQYLATVSKSGDHNRVARQVLATNPLLEAFGNARTLRNDNSSRFGKFIEIQFDRARKMSGARLHIYLLEKSRVIGQSKGERNYHIFYQLLRGLTADERRASHLTLEMEELRLIGRSGCTEIAGMDDAAHFMRTMDAMEAVALSPADQESVLRTLAAVLLLAEVDFEQSGDDHAVVAPGSLPTIEHVAELVAIDHAELSHALCTRRLVTRDDEVTVRLNCDQAEDTRDALAKALYGKLFAWLVERCNAKLVDEDASTSFIGILDIFGFEHFAVNSFEQLCINYANERLQQQFNWDIFKAEQAEYASEGIEWKAIEFVDNQRCLDLIEKKEAMGLLHLLDEECSIQRGTDDKFAQKARERHKDHADFDAPKRDQLSFSISHYAGKVTYSCVGFRDKNKDTLHQDLAAVMQTSASELVLALFPTEAPAAAAAATGPRKPKGKGTDRMTTGSQFMTQLASLMRTINSTDVHYVRCVKPNTSSQPAVFDVPHVAHQLRCAGVLEAVRISRMAYPNRMPHIAFVLRYALLIGRDWQAAHAGEIASARQAPPGNEGARWLCEEALRRVVDDAERYELGKTKVFFRAFLLEVLEQRRGTALGHHAVIVQAALRAALWSRRFQRMRASTIRLQTARRRAAARTMYTRKHAAAIIVSSASRGFLARRLRRRLGAAVRIQAGARARLARQLALRMRRAVAATKLQAHARRHALDVRFGRMRSAALRLQSRARMLAQRRAYRRDLAEKKEEAKLSTQLAKLQAQLQAEIEARQTAEREQERLRNERASGATAVAGPVAGLPAAEKGEELASPADEAATGTDAGQAGSIRSRLAGAAANYLLSMGSGAQTMSSMEETSAMLSLVTKDRERLGQKLAAETEARKRAEAEKRELERRLTMGSDTSQVGTRKTRDIAERLARKTDEVKEMREMMQHQALEIANLRKENGALKRLNVGLEKKVSQYDDSFHTLEARNVRDRTMMDEFAKAKDRAQEEKNIYRLMLEQAHERYLRERHEMRKDAQERIEESTLLIKQQRARISDIEQRLHAQTQIAEEVKMYKEQCIVLMEKLSARHMSAGGASPATPPAQPSPARSVPPSAPSPRGGSMLFERVKSIATAGARSASGEH